MALYEFIRRIQEVGNSYFLPPVCAVCSRILNESQIKEQRLQGGADSIVDGICGSCQRQLPVRFGKDSVFELTHSPSDSSLEPPVLATAVCHYRGQVPQLMAKLKFHDALYLAEPFGQLMVWTLKRTFPEYRPELILPVPLHIKRERERGYNQANELAQVIASKTGLPVLPQAVRRRHMTIRQSELRSPQERRANLEEVFAVTDSNIVGKRILLVDDVLTTGATCLSLSQTLLAGGAASVRVLIFASGHYKDFRNI